MKIKVQAQHLQPGDVVGSGEVVSRVSAGIATPRGKVDVWLTWSDGHTRHSQWGKYTMINVERAEAKKLEGADAIKLHRTLDKLGFK